eukprot:2505835-Pyramimonas_sp.AAC.1
MLALRPVTVEFSGSPLGLPLTHGHGKRLNACASVTTSQQRPSCVVSYKARKSAKTSRTSTSRSARQGAVRGDRLAFGKGLGCETDAFLAKSVSSRNTPHTRRIQTRISAQVNDDLYEVLGVKPDVD